MARQNLKMDGPLHQTLEKKMALNERVILRQMFSGHTNSGAIFTELILEIFRLNGRLLVTGDRISKGLGLTSARWQVLGTLMKAPVPITVPTIGRNMGLQRQSVQRTIDLMAKEGLVELIENPHHRRAKLVRLTDKGRSVIARINKVQVKWANKIAEGIPAADLEKAFQLLRKLRTRLGDRIISP
jgi:DNA-binding MarR family transcriptional regulator